MQFPRVDKAKLEDSTSSSFSLSCDMSLLDRDKNCAETALNSDEKTDSEDDDCPLIEFDDNQLDVRLKILAASKAAAFAFLTRAATAAITPPKTLPEDLTTVVDIAQPSGEHVFSTETATMSNSAILKNKTNASDSLELYLQRMLYQQHIKLLKQKQRTKSKDETKMYSSDLNHAVTTATTRTKIISSSPSISTTTTTIATSFCQLGTTATAAATMNNITSLSSTSPIISTDIVDADNSNVRAISLNPIQITSIDGFFNRKRGRPPKNRFVEVYKNAQQSPQAIFTSFKLEKHEGQRDSAFSGGGNVALMTVGNPSTATNEATSGGTGLNYILEENQKQQPLDMLYHAISEECKTSSSPTHGKKNRHIAVNNNRNQLKYKISTFDTKTTTTVHATTSSTALALYNPFSYDEDGGLLEFDCSVEGCSLRKTDQHLHCKKCFQPISSYNLETHICELTSPGFQTLAQHYAGREGSINMNISKENIVSTINKHFAADDDATMNDCLKEEMTATGMMMMGMLTKKKRFDKVSVIRAAGTFYPENTPVEYKTKKTTLETNKMPQLGSLSGDEDDFGKEYSLGNKNQTNNKTRTTIKNKRRSQRTSASFICDICKTTFTNEAKLQTHYYQQHCDQSFCFNKNYDENKNDVEGNIAETELPQDLSINSGVEKFKKQLHQLDFGQTPTAKRTKRVNYKSTALLNTPFQQLINLYQEQPQQQHWGVNSVAGVPVLSADPLTMPSHVPPAALPHLQQDATVVSDTNISGSSVPHCSNSYSNTTSGFNIVEFFKSVKNAAMKHELQQHMKHNVAATTVASINDVTSSNIESIMEQNQFFFHQQRNRHIHSQKPLQTFKLKKNDSNIPIGYLKFRFNEDCRFPKCGYRNRQSHFHCNRSDCHYSFCDKTRFVQHTARHDRLDTLMGDDFQQYRANMDCGYAVCRYYMESASTLPLPTSQTAAAATMKKSSHFHCLKCEFICSDTNKVVAHRRLHSKMEFIRMAGFRKVASTENCLIVRGAKATTTTLTETPATTSSELDIETEMLLDSPCSYNLKQTHYHCLVCDCGVLSRSQLVSHKHKLTTATTTPTAMITPPSAAILSMMTATTTANTIASSLATSATTNPYSRASSSYPPT